MGECALGRYGPRLSRRSRSHPVTPTALLMRRSVRASPTAHSHTRSTFQPSRRSLRETRRSLRRLAVTLSRQNPRLVFDGLSHRGQPCQKHPSTNRATFAFGQAKSGLPATDQCFRNPLTWLLRRIASILRSTVVPNEGTDAMIFERTSRVTLSRTFF